MFSEPVGISKSHISMSPLHEVVSKSQSYQHSLDVSVYLIAKYSPWIIIETLENQFFAPIGLSLLRSSPVSTGSRDGHVRDGL